MAFETIYVCGFTVHIIEIARFSSHAECLMGELNGLNGDVLLKVSLGQIPSLP